MNAVAQSVPFFLLAALGFLCAGSLAAAGLALWIRPRLPRWEPRVRHRLLLQLAALPLLTAPVLLMAATLPPLLGLFLPVLDHCLRHGGHTHLCFRHLPKGPANWPSHLVLISAGTYVACRIVRSFVRAWRGTRTLRQLQVTGTQHSALGVTVIAGPQPLCFAAGLWRPRILISDGLLRMLDADQRAVVLAHERAHVRRRDALAASFVHACSVLHLPAIASWLERELAIAAEQACDDEAAEVVGDRITVAETILTVERAAYQHVAPGLEVVSVAMVACAIQRRVEALLRDRLRPPSLQPLHFALSASAVALLGSAAELHHLTESILSLIAR